MYQFVWPFVLCLLPLPWILRHVSPPVHNHVDTGAALRVPFFKTLTQIGTPISTDSNKISPVLWSLVWCCFVLAAMRPLWLGDPIVLPQEARNIVLTLDVSGSMEEQDFNIQGQPITRLNIVKILADDFIQKRTGDNLGLVIFGSGAYTYMPLSPDTQTLRSLLSEIGIGIAGTQTAMGDALALAVQTAITVPAKSRIVILMSDGYANAGAVSVEEALSLAKKADVKVYTIGIGSDPQSLQGLFSMARLNASLDLDEKTLKQIAQETGGQYFLANSTQELKQIYDLINQLETTQSKDVTLRPQKELFYIPALLGLLLWLWAFYKRSFA
ncbi:MAG: VWA domain-containing protein [Alphaproteobacteria bacterium]|nr:VWA domain-containing protein [Alphaproteobacteria bacterium]